MTFLLPTDPDYLHAKRIKQGIARIDPSYARFLERFQARYRIAPLAVSLDSVARPRGRGRFPRLSVVLERTEEYRTFRAACNFDKAKQQQIARLLTESVPARILRADFGLPPRMLRMPPADIFVCFEDFERVAKWEVHDLATAAELEGFTASLAIPDQFWCIQRFVGPPIVFVHTEQQARALRASSAPASWADSYFELAKRHDEFGYLERSEITIEVDSKENFETNYSGNWYYYFK